MKPIKEKKNIFLKVILIVQVVGVFIYTSAVMKIEGSNFIAVAATNLMSLNWNGQFSLDFYCYLILSALWIMWRNKFSFSSIIIAILAHVLGVIVFGSYLFYLLVKERGDLKKLLVGDRLN